MKETLKLALEALEECRRDPRLKYEHPAYDKTITAIKEALAQPEQEPVAFLVYDPQADSHDLYFDEDLGDTDCCEITPLYTTPPQRKPLTDEEIKEAINSAPQVETDHAGWVGEQRLLWGRAIEAKLKEKNT